MGLLGASPWLVLAFPALAACSDSLHLDPPAAPAGGQGGTSSAPSAGPGGPGGGESGSGGEGGAEAPPACESSSECPAPTSVCDPVRGLCVECLEHADCVFRPGTICSLGACRCPSPSEEFCPASPGRAARCADLQTSSEDCGTCGHGCFGACSEGKCADPWRPTPTTGAPSPRARHVGVWAQSRLVIWGGDAGGAPLKTGGLYDPGANAWSPTSVANAPIGRSYATAVWTGSKMIVWGGYSGAALGTGGIFDPATNTWATMSSDGAPEPRYFHSAVWTGKAMIVFGGYSGSSTLGSGAKYDPELDAWTPIAALGTSRREHSAVWTGSRMLVFGGLTTDTSEGVAYLSSGFEYDPATDAWSALTESSAPSPRARHTSVWTGSEMLVWGGGSGSEAQLPEGGAKYKIAETSWTPMNGPFPAPRQHHSAVWIDDRMIVWGGEGSSGHLDSGGIFDPSINAWIKATPTAPAARSHHVAVVAAGSMIVWGGETSSGFTDTGAIFTP